MHVVEVILLGSAALLTMSMYVSYRRLNRLVKRIKVQSKDIDRSNQQARKRLEEAIAFRQETLQARDRALKEAESLTAYWRADRLN